MNDTSDLGRFLDAQAGIYPQVPDDLKFHSSMTLFDLVAAPNSPFADALDTYFAGERDQRTLKLALPGKPG